MMTCGRKKRGVREWKCRGEQMADGGTHGYQKRTHLPTTRKFCTQEEGGGGGENRPLTMTYFSLFLTLTHFYGFLWGHLIHRAVFAWPTSKAFSSIPERGKKNGEILEKIKIENLTGHKRNWKQYHPFDAKVVS